MTPTACGGAGSVLPALVAGLSGPPAIILGSTSHSLSASIAATAQIAVTSAAGSNGSSASGGLSIASSGSPNSASANAASGRALIGCGGLSSVFYDASQAGTVSATPEPLTLPPSPLTLADGEPEARITPLVLYPGRDAVPGIILGVWIGEGTAVFLVGDGEGNEAITAPRVGDGIETHPTGSALPDSQPASDLASVELEPKVAAQILAALSRGDLQLAMELLAGIGAKGANLAPKFLEKIQGLHRIKDGQCEDIASRTAAVFRTMGDSPVILRITDSRGTLVWRYGGEIMTNQGFHEATNNAGRIYDHLTGPAGMPLEEYLRLLRTVVGITPEILTK